MSLPTTFFVIVGPMKNKELEELDKVSLLNIFHTFMLSVKLSIAVPLA